MTDTLTGFHQLPFETQLKALQTQINQALNRWLPSETQQPEKLHQAMRYAVIGGGKRIRPVLVYATGIALDIPTTRLDSPACAIELIHAYSLIHDDLPAMDDDDLRRGQPTCHIAFDEATAILAGDALQTLAFEILATDPTYDTTPNARIAMLKTLTQASGSHGMVGGQAIDLAAINQTLDLPALENMHRHKTGALIEACIRMACHNTPEHKIEEQTQLGRYARAIGLAFQVQDDILDIISDTQTLGKQQGADIALNKPTFPSLLGLEGAQQKALELHGIAIDSLAGFGKQADLLRNIAHYIIKRMH